MTYRYFVGCTSFVEVKKKYKVLALQHHPDKGGNEEIFKEVASEYSKISKDATLSYPLSNTQKSNNVVFDFEEMIRNFAEATRKDAQRYQRQYQQTRDFAERQRKTRRERVAYSDEYWKQMIEEDVIFSTIDTLIVEAISMNKTVPWIMFEMCKLDDLTLEHFKFVRWNIRNRANGGGWKRFIDNDLNDTWVAQEYQRYCDLGRFRNNNTFTF